MLKPLARRAWQRFAAPHAAAQRPNHHEGKEPSGDSRPAADPSAKQVDKELRVMRSEIQELRREVRSRLLQYHHQLGRLTKVLQPSHNQTVEDERLSGRAVPQESLQEHSVEWDAIGNAPPDPDGREWRQLVACPVCAATESTVVNPWNKFILTAKAPDDTSVQYDYSLCHSCGVLFAARRPTGSRYRFLLAHFGEVTAKRGGTAQITNRVLNPYPLDDAGRAELLRLADPGIYVSDHLGLRDSDYLAPMLRDRLESCVHVDILGALLHPRDARVLEIRSRTGAILDGLRRAWNATVFAMPIWERQQFILREILNIPTSELIDFEHFAIPFEGRFDLIVCNHMLTHSIAPAAFLAEVRQRLVPGGHIYLHGEPDDVEYLEGNQSMFATLNPLHMQAFDQASMMRLLEACGFETVFIKRRNLQHLVLARAVDEPKPLVPMTPSQRDERIDQYRRAFHRAVLGVDESLRERVSPYWAAAVEGAIGSGIAEYDERGQVRLVAREALEKRGRKAQA